MKCPECKKEFHSQPDSVQAYRSADEGAAFGNGFALGIQLCPSCHMPIVVYYEGKVLETSGGDTRLMSTTSERVVYPVEEVTELPSEVPDQYRVDFEEARTALDYSAKASAALSRRLLQRVLREELKIHKRDLSQEIDEFVDHSGAPSYLAGAVDAVRSIGNFAAHPLKSTNSGEIVDVEEGEAEWLVEVLESLFDFVFVQPRKLAERRRELNEKLRDLGKPELKGA